MYSRVIEAIYPLAYRRNDATALGDHLRHRHSVTMIGMKRVGISNFLRFFFSHSSMRETYIQDSEKHIFIVVDLNDLIEREIFPFWTLTLKRIADTVERVEISVKRKKKIEAVFLKAIQLQDHFMTMDSVMQTLVMLVEWGYLPTLFMVHFDRIKNTVTPAFFDNLESLLNATGNKLSYVFTSYRSLDELSPEVFNKNPLPFYCENMYLKLARKEDMETIFTAYNNRYKLKLNPHIKKTLFEFVNGHIQYLQLSLLALQESPDEAFTSDRRLLELLISDERIVLQSEELWESLRDKEKGVLLKVLKSDAVSGNEKRDASYLWDTAIIQDKNGRPKIFSVLLKNYLEQSVAINTETQPSIHFSKKENLLFKLLEKNVKQICERELIVSIVWPEYGDTGISDWAIDRLVARVRTKLRVQKSKYEIKTIRTRGYQLVEK